MEKREKLQNFLQMNLGSRQNPMQLTFSGNEKDFEISFNPSDGNKNKLFCAGHKQIWIPPPAKTSRRIKPCNLYKYPNQVILSLPGDKQCYSPYGIPLMIESSHLENFKAAFYPQCLYKESKVVDTRPTDSGDPLKNCKNRIKESFDKQCSILKESERLLKQHDSKRKVLSKYILSLKKNMQDIEHCIKELEKCEGNNIKKDSEYKSCRHPFPEKKDSPQKNGKTKLAAFTTLDEHRSGKFKTHGLNLDELSICKECKPKILKEYSLNGKSVSKDQSLEIRKISADKAALNKKENSQGNISVENVMVRLADSMRKSKQLTDSVCQQEETVGSLQKRYIQDVEALYQDQQRLLNQLYHVLESSSENSTSSEEVTKDDAESIFAPESKTMISPEYDNGYSLKENSYKRKNDELHEIKLNKYKLNSMPNIASYKQNKSLEERLAQANFQLESLKRELRLVKAADRSKEWRHCNEFNRVNKSGIGISDRTGKLDEGHDSGQGSEVTGSIMHKYNTLKTQNYEEKTYETTLNHKIRNIPPEPSEREKTFVDIEELEIFPSLTTIQNAAKKLENAVGKLLPVIHENGADKKDSKLIPLHIDHFEKDTLMRMKDEKNVEIDRVIRKEGKPVSIRKSDDKEEIEKENFPASSRDGKDISVRLKDRKERIEDEIGNAASKKIKDASTRPKMDEEEIDDEVGLVTSKYGKDVYIRKKHKKERVDKGVGRETSKEEVKYDRGRTESISGLVSSKDNRIKDDRIVGSDSRTKNGTGERNGYILQSYKSREQKEEDTQKTRPESYSKTDHFAKANDFEIKDTTHSPMGSNGNLKAHETELEGEHAYKLPTDNGGIRSESNGTDKVFVRKFDESNDMGKVTHISASDSLPKLTSKGSSGFETNDVRGASKITSFTKPKSRYSDIPKEEEIVQEDIRKGLKSIGTSISDSERKAAVTIPEISRNGFRSTSDTSSLNDIPDFRDIAESTRIDAANVSSGITRRSDKHGLLTENYEILPEKRKDTKETQYSSESLQSGSISELKSNGQRSLKYRKVNGENSPKNSALQKLGYCEDSLHSGTISSLEANGKQITADEHERVEVDDISKEYDLKPRKLSFSDSLQEGTLSGLESNGGVYPVYESSNSTKPRPGEFEILTPEPQYATERLRSRSISQTDTRRFPTQEYELHTRQRDFGVNTKDLLSDESWTQLTPRDMSSDDEEYEDSRRVSRTMPSAEAKHSNSLGPALYNSPYKIPIISEPKAPRKSKCYDLKRIITTTPSRYKYSTATDKRYLFPQEAKYVHSGLYDLQTAKHRIHNLYQEIMS